MATRSSSKSTSIVDAEARSKAGSSKNHTAEPEYHRQVADKCGLDCCVSKHDGTYQNDHTSQGLKPSTRTFRRATRLPSLKREDTPEYSIRLDPGSPVLLSPTDSVSSASSPGAENDLWGTPETPLLRPGRTPTTEVLTPLTPLTTYDEDNEQSPIPKATKSLRTRGIRRAVATDTVASRTASVDIEKEDLEADDYFQPKKVVRNLTKELRASKSQSPRVIIVDKANNSVPVADALVVAAKDNHRLKPKFEPGSSQDSRSDISSRKSKVQTRYTTKLDDSESLLKIREPSTKPNIDVVPRVRTLSKELKVLEHIVSFSIKDRLRDLPQKCVASLVGNPEKRCTSSGPAQSTDIIFNEISRCNIDTESTKLLRYIRALVQAVQCGTHCNAALSPLRTKKLTDIASDLSQLSEKDRSDFKAWVKAISNRNRALDVRDHIKKEVLVDEKPARSEVSHSKPPPSTPRASRARNTPVLSSSPEFSRYQPLWSKRLSEFSALHKVIAEKLKPSHLKSGFIYVFSEKEHPEKVKIGCTNNLKRRLEEWNTKCQRTHIYHPSMREFSEIPHMSRIERLMHIELKEFRFKRECKNCMTIHHEWFEIEGALAVEVFRKWHDWIIQKPYALNPQSQEWEIKPEMKHTLEAVCQPVSLRSTQKTQPLPGVDEKSRPASKEPSIERGGRNLRAR
jgi:hypothetical protein